MKIITALIDKVHYIDEEIDFSKNIIGNPDILEINNSHVKGNLIFDNNKLMAKLNINTNLVLASSRSLLPIEHKLNFDLELIFSNDSDADYVLENEIELGDIIYGNILLEKPVSIYLEDEKEVKKEKPKVINPAFSELKDWNI